MRILSVAAPEYAWSGELPKNIYHDNIMKIRLPKSLLAALLFGFLACDGGIYAAETTIDINTESSENLAISNSDRFIVTNGASYDMSKAGTFQITKGSLEVKDESTFLGGYNNFWVYDGDIRLEENSNMEVCTYAGGGQNYRVLLGLGDSGISVNSGSTFKSSASQFVTNYYGGHTTEITVNGAGSKFILTAQTQSTTSYPVGTSGVWEYKYNSDLPSEFQGNKDRPDGWYDRDSTRLGSSNKQAGDTITYICDNGTNKVGLKYDTVNGCTANISATEGGTVDFQSTITYIGSFQDKEKGYTDKTANLTVGSGSEMSFKRMEIYADTNITNGGTFNATEVTVHDGAVLSYTATGEADIEVDSLTVKDGAELSLIFGEAPEEVVTFALSRTGESSASMLLDTMLTLESGSVLNIEGGILDLGGKALTIADGAIINVLGLDEEAGIQTLFTNVGQLTMEEGASVTFNGTATQLSYNGNSVVVGAVPEPTAATLSLLALAGLAGRRRRK